MAKRVLVVEDDEFLAKVLAHKLTGVGYVVDKVIDGMQALTKIGKHEYDLILTDLIMPLYSGFELLQELKSQESKTPVLVFSNLAQPEDEEEVIRLGAKALVKKSMPMEQLLVMVGRYMK
jgi:CheY-like chemotaxis protein